MEESVFYNLSQDETLGGDSPSIHKIPSQAALKAYIDSKAGSGGPNYFYVEDASGAANTLTIKKSNNALPDKVFEWSLDKQNWTEITVTDTTGVSIAVPANGRVYLRGDNVVLGENGSNYILIDCAGIYDIGGDLTTLVSVYGHQNVIPYRCFYRLFFGSTQLISATDLIIGANRIDERGLGGLFYNCSALTAAPDLPATVLNNGSYEYTFAGCTALVSAPELPATLTSSCASCYSNMFSGCTSLVNAPILPSPMLANSCYIAMFRNCSALHKIIIYASAWVSQSNWLQGVAATGDFYNLGGATIPTGTDGIPSGWTEHTQLP